MHYSCVYILLHDSRGSSRTPLDWDGEDLRICSRKEEIMHQVVKIPGLEKLSIVFLAMADALLEDGFLLQGWRTDLVPYEMKKIQVVGIYDNYPY